MATARRTRSVRRSCVRPDARRYRTPPRPPPGGGGRGTGAGLGTRRSFGLLDGVGAPIVTRYGGSDHGDAPDIAHQDLRVGSGSAPEVSRYPAPRRWMS